VQSLVDWLGGNTTDVEPMMENQMQITTDFATGQDIAVTLSERGNRYGAFPGHARISQNLKRVMVDSPNWPDLTDAQREALEMVAHKIGRILNGDPNYHDSWHDIVGYTKLVADELRA
jgi:hypothetical protein